MQPKIRMTEKVLVGAIFAAVGAFFLALGLPIGLLAFAGDPIGQAMFLMMFCGIGGLFLVMGLFFLRSEVKRRRNLQELVDHNQYVMADIVGVQAQNSGSGGRAYGYRVECHYRDPGTDAMHVYFSRVLNFDPTDMITSRQVRVYVDPYDENCFLVDVDAVLPEMKIHRD